MFNNINIENFELELVKRKILGYCSIHDELLCFEDDFESILVAAKLFQILTHREYGGYLSVNEAVEEVRTLLSNYPYVCNHCDVTWRSDE